jgi:NADP-dependent 3-hydroxy acid dehydrogenase YdfG
VVDEAGDVHVLCNNAGIIRPGRMWELTADDWSSIMDVNVAGVVNGIRAFVPRMLAHGAECHVVNTASAAGLFSAPAFGGYCASKAAVIAVSEALAADVAQLPDARLVVSVLCPGSVVSNLFRDEVERRAVRPESSEATARAWGVSADPDRTDQVQADVIADAVWSALGARQFWIVPMQPHMREAALARLRQLEDALSTSAVPSNRHATATVLAEYYARVDGPTPASALDLVAEHLSFCLARPEARIVGSSRDALAEYIDARSPLSHRLLRTARDGDVEFALGESVDGDRSLGAFVAAMRIDATSRICEYRATFFPETGDSQR